MGKTEDEMRDAAKALPEQFLGQKFADLGASQATSYDEIEKLYLDIGAVRERNAINAQLVSHGSVDSVIKRGDQLALHNQTVREGIAKRARQTTQLDLILLQNYHAIQIELEGLYKQREIYVQERDNFQTAMDEAQANIDAIKEEIEYYNDTGDFRRDADGNIVLNDRAEAALATYEAVHGPIDRTNPRAVLEALDAQCEVESANHDAASAGRDASDAAIEDTDTKIEDLEPIAQAAEQEIINSPNGYGMAEALEMAEEVGFDYDEGAQAASLFGGQADASAEDLFADNAQDIGVRVGPPQIPETPAPELESLTRQ